MSRVMIISTHWLEKSTNLDGELQEMKASLFKDNVVYPLDKRKESTSVYSQALQRKYALYSADSRSLSKYIRQHSGDNYIQVLVDLAKELLTTGLDDQEIMDFFKEDIENADRDGLIEDIYEALKNSVANSKLCGVFSSFFSALDPPLSYFKEDNSKDGLFRAIGISCLPYSRAGIQLCNKWCDSLIEDFSAEGDEVILALHGSSDWKEENPLLEPKLSFSNELSVRTKRSIKVFVFYHDDKDCIGAALKSYNQGLPLIWEKLINVWDKEAK